MFCNKGKKEKELQVSLELYIIKTHFSAFFKQGRKIRLSEKHLAKWGHLHTSFDASILHLGGKWHIRGSIFVNGFETPKLQTNWRRRIDRVCLSEWWTGTSKGENQCRAPFLLLPFSLALSFSSCPKLSPQSSQHTVGVCLRARRLKQVPFLSTWF